MSSIVWATVLAALFAVQAVNGLFGGTPVAVGDHPSQVLVRLPNGGICGGTIVNANHIVTSAGCILNEQNHLIAANQTHVQAGVTTFQPIGADTMRLAAIFPHPHYSPFTEEHDIAVLRIQQNFAFDLTTARPPIAPVDRYLRVVADNTQCRVAGFNAPTDAVPLPVLQTIAVPIRPRDTCNTANFHAGVVRESMICAGVNAANTPAAICPSTRGAGLFCNDHFVGVASFGFGCGVSNLPGVYTQVRNYDAWIQSQFTRTRIPVAGPTPHPGAGAGTGYPAALLIGAAVVTMLAL